MNIFVHLLIATAVTALGHSSDMKWRMKRSDYSCQFKSRIRSMPPFLQDIVRHMEKLCAQWKQLSNDIDGFWQAFLKNLLFAVLDKSDYAEILRAEDIKEIETII